METRMNGTRQLPITELARLAMVLAAAVVTACASDAPPGAAPPRPTEEPTVNDNDDTAWDVLEERVVDYNHALRTASLKLVLALPTLEQVRKVELAPDPRVAYEAELDAMFVDARFRRRMLKFWRDAMRQGGGAAEDRPSRDTAPAFAARIVVEERRFSELFTATTNNCPGYDEATDTFVDGECDSGAPVQAGVLTNPGAMHHLYSGMALHRVRWLQEVFVCGAFPAEHTESPIEIDGKQYAAPWPIASLGTSPINFQDTTNTLICASCHGTMHHIAPLFAYFDAMGRWQPTIQVKTAGDVPTEMSHWLAPGETTAWRFGQPVADLAELGRALADDPAVARCAVARLWNFTMSKEDIVLEQATVPAEVLAPYVQVYHDSGENLKSVLRTMFTSDDFVRR
jgi:hypothetical protein